MSTLEMYKDYSKAQEFPDPFDHMLVSSSRILFLTN